MGVVTNTAVQTPKYLVRTVDGYVGRWTVSGPTVTDMPRGFASVYEDAVTAQQISDTVGGTIETL